MRNLKSYILITAIAVLFNFAVVDKATAQCFVRATHTDLNVANTTAPTSGVSINTGNDVNSNGLHVWVCDGGTPQIFWDDGSGHISSNTWKIILTK